MEKLFSYYLPVILPINQTVFNFSESYKLNNIKYNLEETEAIGSYKYSPTQYPCGPWTCATVPHCWDSICVWVYSYTLMLRTDHHLRLRVPGCGLCDLYVCLLYLSSHLEWCTPSALFQYSLKKEIHKQCLNLSDAKVRYQGYKLWKLHHKMFRRNNLKLIQLLLKQHPISRPVHFVPG